MTKLCKFWVILPWSKPRLQYQRPLEVLSSWAQLAAAGGHRVTWELKISWNRHQLRPPRKWGCSSVWKCFACISTPWRRLPSAARAIRSLAFALYQFHIHKTSRWSRAARSICPSKVMVIYTEPLRKSEVRRVTALCSPWDVQQPQAGIEILLSEMDTLLDRGALTSWVFCAEVLGGNAN